MRLLQHRPCRVLFDLLVICTLSLAAVVAVSQFWTNSEPLRSFLSPDELVPLLTRDFPDHFSRRSESQARAMRPCTMDSCFDRARCSGPFRVYVYPQIPGQKLSPLYAKILQALRESRYYTSDPNEACLLVPSVDTLDRDRRSNSVPSPSLRGGLQGILPHWNGGRNHMIFNFFLGTYPSYTETFDFDSGQAIVARASASTERFRRDFDISLPLVYPDHPLRNGEPSQLSKRGNLLPIERKYLLSFKGKRYLYGIGSETRSSLYHIHNGRDIMLLTTCKHNEDWKRYQDDRCITDNDLYDRYDYSELMANGSFCLAPRGRRLGTYRLLESLRASCIPVSMSNGVVLPFYEVIDWHKTALLVDERQLLQVPHMVRSVPAYQLLAMRMQTNYLWETYFNTVEKIVMTSLEIVRRRLEFKSSLLTWSMAPGGMAFQPSFSRDLLDYPFYQPLQVPRPSSVHFTAVIQCETPALRASSPLVKLVKSIATASHLAKIVLLWSGDGPPRLIIPPLPVPLVLVERSLKKNLTAQFWPLPNVTTDAVLFLREGTELSAEEAEFGFSAWKSFPDRLVGFVAHKHYRDMATLGWSYTSHWTNDISIVLTGALFYHRYFGYHLVTSLPPKALALANSDPLCLDIAFNFLASTTTGKPPLKVTHRKALTLLDTPSPFALQQLTTARNSCLAKLFSVFGRMPLVHSAVRADPVLFRDNVSVLRKEFRKMETL